MQSVPLNQAATAGVPDPGCGAIDCPTLAPEPSTVFMLGTALLVGGIILWLRQRRLGGTRN